MSKREKYENRLMQTVILLLGLTLISLWMLSNMYAKYVSQGEGTDSARVAQFHVTATDNFSETYELNPSMTDNDTQKIQIKVTNKSEVATKYIFNFQTDGNVPFDIKGTGPDGTTLTKSEDKEQWEIDKSPKTNWDETYTFTIAMKNTEENYQYAGGVGSIKMTVTAEQID